MKIFFLLSILALANGCASQGCISIADMDFRKPAQIEAGIREFEAPYKNWDIDKESKEEIPQIKAEALPIIWWETILNAISKLECRITVFQIRWRDTGK